MAQTRRRRIVITPEMKRALYQAEQDAGRWADARIPGAGRRHRMLVPTFEQAEHIAALERLKERVREERTGG